MDIDFQNIFDKAKQVKLSSIEKEEMRTGLELFARKHPVRNADTARLLLQERSKSYAPAFAEILTLKPLINKLQPMSIALIIALIVGGGTSFAAEGALPGDALYPVKVSINEEVRSFAAFSNEAQARWDARRAERRLEETEKLAAEGRLNAETGADIESRFESHAKAFEEQTKKIESKQNTNASLEINSDFEASLKAHERVLAQIVAEKANIRAVVAPLLIEVRTRLNTTAAVRSDAEAEISVKTDGEFKTAAEGKLKAAENKINEARNFIVRMKSSVSASANAHTEARLKVAESVVARGKTEMEAQMYGKAFASFQEAIRVAQETKSLVATEERIKLEIKPLNVDIRIEGETRGGSEQGTSFGSSVEVESKTKVEEGSDAAGVEGSGKVKIDIGL